MPLMITNGVTFTLCLSTTVCFHFSLSHQPHEFHKPLFLLSTALYVLPHTLFSRSPSCITVCSARLRHVDVFSFGIALWEHLIGEEPYADLHYGAIIGGVLSNALQPPVPESCDREWRSLMERCWSGEPPERLIFTAIANELRSMAAKFPPKGQNQTQQPPSSSGRPQVQK